MGFDIKALAAKVEKLVYGDSENKNRDGVINTAEESTSLFNIVRNKDKFIEKGLFTQDEANQIFGLNLSQNAVNARRAGEGGDGGSDTTIVINNNINITINVSVEVQQIIEGFIGGGDLDALVEKLIAALGKNEKALEEFLVGIINKYADDLGLDLSQINNTLKQILEKLKEQGIQIENMEGAITNLLKQQIELLKVMGFDLDALLENSNITNDQLGDIYEAVVALTNNFNSSTGETKVQLNEIINQLKQGNISLDEVLKFLKNINQDTSENKEISKAILDTVSKYGVEFIAKFNELLAQGEQGLAIAKEILEAIKNLEIGDSEALKEFLEGLKGDLGDIKALLASINNNVIKNGEEGQKLGKLILEAIKKLGEDNAEILKYLKLISEGVDKGNVNLTKIIELLENLDKKAEQFNIKADLLLKGISDILDKLDQGFKDIEVAIQDHDVHVTVDISGNVTCECHCGCNNNEGIIPELTGILNARGIDFDDSTGIKNTEFNNNKPKNGKVIENGRIVIYKNGVKFDTFGKRIQ